MKRIFVSLASLAVSASMLTFAGCGDKPGDGVIEGNYTEKTPEEIEGIIDNIDGDKVFGGEDGEPNLNLGLKVNLSGGYSMGEITSGSISTQLDLKLASNENNIVGAGSATLSYDSSSSAEGDSMQSSAEYKGTAYLENFVVYAEATGTSSASAEGQNREQKIDKKIKLDLLKIFSYLEESDFSLSLPFTVRDSSVCDRGISVSGLLEKADEYGIKVAVDDKDGVKFKLSATEDTVWAVASTMLGEETSLDTIKKGVSINKFQFDLYFALDKNDAFSGAGAVVDIDVVIDSSLFANFMDSEDEQLPLLAIDLKGTVEVFTHSDKVSVPADLATDESYYDGTDMIIELIDDYI